MITYNNKSMHELVDRFIKESRNLAHWRATYRIVDVTRNKLIMCQNLDGFKTADDALIHLRDQAYKKTRACETNIKNLEDQIYKLAKSN